MDEVSMRVLCDSDSVIADFFPPLFREYARRTGEIVTVDQIKTWDMGKHVSQPDVLYGIFMEPGFFRNLQPMPGAVEALRAWVDAGIEVVVATSPCTAHSAAEKIEWCVEHVPFIDPKGLHGRIKVPRNLWIGHDKHHIVADVMVDDGPHNALAYRKAHPDAFIATIAYPYNEAPDGSDAPYNWRCGHWSDPAAAWAEIRQLVLAMKGARDLLRSNLGGSAS